MLCINSLASTSSCEDVSSGTSLTSSFVISKHCSATVTINVISPRLHLASSSVSQKQAVFGPSASSFSTFKNAERGAKDSLLFHDMKSGHQIKNWKHLLANMESK